MKHRRNMDAFTKKHLRTWLQQSVFAGDRRKVGKLIRAYVRRHPEVLTELPSQSWPQIQRLAEASGINPRDAGVLQKQRDARDRAAQIRTASGRNPRRVVFDSSIQKYMAHKYLSKYGNLVGTGETKAAAVRSLKEAIARAKGGSRNPWHAAGNFKNYEAAMDRKRQLEAAGHTVNVIVSARGTSAENYSVYTRTPVGENPAELLVMAANPRVEVVHGDNPPVEEITEDFTGSEVKWLDVYNEPHIPRGRYAYLAKLYRLMIKPATGGQVQKITFGEGDAAPLIVSDSTGKQIYFVGGNQDLFGMLGTFVPRGDTSDPVRLGEARELHYLGIKHHIGDEDTEEWRHKHGEEDGALPTVLFDTRNKRLLYEGGNYRIEGPWIHN